MMLMILTRRAHWGYVLLLLVLATRSIGGTTASARRPPFVAHVTSRDLERARAVAQERHEWAFQQAREHYPVHRISTNSSSTGNSTTTPVAEAAAPVLDVSKVKFQTHKLHRVCLPDFQELLQGANNDSSEEPCVTFFVTDHDSSDTEGRSSTTELLSRDECAAVVQMAEDHFAGEQGGWTRQTSGQYGVLGFMIRDVPTVHAWFLQLVRDKMGPVLRHLYPDFLVNDDDADEWLCVDHSYLFKYTPTTGRRTDIHTDSGCLSFTICLNDDFEGGGTWFQGLRPSTESTAPTSSSDDESTTTTTTSSSTTGAVLEMRTPGQITVRPGGVKHCGHAVTAGTRYIIGGFCLHPRRVETIRLLLADPTDRPSLEAAIVLRPDLDAGYNLLANWYLQQDNNNMNKTKAQEILEYCLEHVDPHASEVAYTLASLYMDQGLFRPARTCLERVCLQVDPDDADARLAMAQCAAALGDTQQEWECYRAIVAMPPGSGVSDQVLATAYCNLGVLHQNDSNDSDIEIEYYRKCLELKPNTFVARYSLGSALASRQDYEPACREFRRAVDIAQQQDSKDETSRHQTKKALHALYQATARWMQQQQQDPLAAPVSRDEMLQRFRDVMGSDNFDQMTALSGRR